MAAAAHSTPAAELLACIQAERAKNGKPAKPLSPLTEAELTELPSLPEGWCWVKLGNVSADMCLDKMIDKQKNKGEYQPYLRNTNVRWERFDLSDLLEMRFEADTGAGLANLAIPVCSYEEQHAIVAEIEARLSVIDKLEETIETSLQEAEALRQSILKQAFAGKLVAQNPADEPAALLLERIKTQKALETL